MYLGHVCFAPSIYPFEVIRYKVPEPYFMQIKTANFLHERMLWIFCLQETVSAFLTPQGIAQCCCALRLRCSESIGPPKRSALSRNAVSESERQNHLVVGACFVMVVCHGQMQCRSPVAPSKEFKAKAVGIPCIRTVRSAAARARCASLRRPVCSVAVGECIAVVLAPVRLLAS